MDFTVLNTDFQTIDILEEYESIIWVDKFAEPGTFELYTPVTDDIIKYLKPNYYIINPKSDRVMIIEDISYESDIEKGNHIKAVGRSLESLLDRRIVWEQKNYNNVLLNTVIADLLNNAIVSPTIVDRKIDNFLAYTASDDSYISSLKVNHQYTGDNLLEVIKNLCAEFKIGFKITLNDDNQFVFSLYRGENRSYSQTTNPYVVFSPKFDNILSSTYTDEISKMKNVNLVGGEGTGSSRKFKTVGVCKGLERREMFTDAADIQKGNLSNSKYMALLEKRGISKLDETNRKISFDSECDTNRLYVYGESFFIGDIVQIANEYGIEASAKITEFTWSFSESGIETYPTFLAMEETIIKGKNLLVTTLDDLQTLNVNGEWTDNVWTYSNLVLTVNLDAYNRVVGITVDGTNSLTSAITFDLGQIVSSNENLVLSGCTGGASTTYKISQYDKTSSTEGAINYDGDTAITTINLEHDNHVRFTLAKSKSVNNITLYPMVRVTSDTSTFEPYDPELHQT